MARVAKGIFVGFSAAMLVLPAEAQAGPRVWISIDRGWRFTHGDPPDVTAGSLMYDVRPVFRGENAHELAAEATSDAAKLAASSRPVC